jgi:hypothetical protein
VLAAEFGMEPGLADGQKISRDHWSLFQEACYSEWKVFWSNSKCPSKGCYMLHVWKERMLLFV